MENFSATDLPDDFGFSSHLILLKKFSDYYQYFYQVYKNLPKIDKYHLGQKILDENLETYILIYKISKTNRQNFQKNKILVEINEKLDVLKFLIRNCFEMKIIKLNQYTTLAVQIIEIGKITGGLIKSLSTSKDR